MVMFTYGEFGKHISTCKNVLVSLNSKWWIFGNDNRKK